MSKDRDDWLPTIRVTPWPSLLDRIRKAVDGQPEDTVVYLEGQDLDGASFLVTETEILPLGADRRVLEKGGFRARGPTPLLPSSAVEARLGEAVPPEWHEAKSEAMDAGIRYESDLGIKIQIDDSLPEDTMILESGDSRVVMKNVHPRRPKETPLQACEARLEECTTALHRLAREAGVPDEGPTENVGYTLEKLERVTRERDDARQNFDNLCLALDRVTKERDAAVRKSNDWQAAVYYACHGLIYLVEKAAEGAEVEGDWSEGHQWTLGELRRQLEETAKKTEGGHPGEQLAEVTRQRDEALVFLKAIQTPIRCMCGKCNPPDNAQLLFESMCLLRKSLRETERQRDEAREAAKATAQIHYAMACSGLESPCWKWAGIHGATPNDSPCPSCRLAVELGVVG